MGDHSNQKMKNQSSVCPYLICGDALGAIEFYKNVFGAQELMRLEEGGGKIGHADLMIGDTQIMISSESLDRGIRSPLTYGGTPVRLQIYVDDVDTVFQRALDAGARVRSPVADQFWGERMGTIEDPFGHVWLIAMQKEEVSPEEMQRRYNEQLKGGSSS